jgi:hypothetical protein
MANSNLAAAKKARKDEFYTQWGDIEREMNAYLEYNPDVFRGKTVLLPCDDPEWSNFTKFFALHFADFGLKKLISTSYAPESNYQGAFYEPTLFEIESPLYDQDMSRVRGRVFTLLPEDVSGDGAINIDDLHWEYLEGDGDFRSAEVTSLRDEADIIATNPPFSLFREFVAWLTEGGKQFTTIGPQSAITYVDIFPLIQENRMWLGKGFSGGDAYFKVPDSVEPGYAAGVFDEETRTVHFRNVCWFTSIDHGRRHEPLQLMTMADNIKFSKHKEVRGVGYERYVNFDAIEVPFTDAIPSDYDGVMGVPVSFLTKHNPDQFEIIANLDDHAGLREVGVEPISEEFIAGYRAVGGTGAQRAGGYWPGLANPNRFPYKRIFIRPKDAS